MVLSQPENKHVLKAFDLTGKVAAITGTFLTSRVSKNTMLTLSRGCPWYWS